MHLLRKPPFLALLSGLLCACAQLPATPAAAPALPPLAAPSGSLPASLSQTLYAAFGSQDAALSCGMQSGVNGWRAVCVNALGLRVLTLGVDASGTLTAERGAGVPESLDPHRVLADMQLCLWPLAELKIAYAGSDWQVDEPIAHTRRLKHAGRLYAEVHYAPQASTLWLSNLAYGYTLSIITEANTPP